MNILITPVYMITFVRNQSSNLMTLMISDVIWKTVSLSFDLFLYSFLFKLFIISVHMNVVSKEFPDSSIFICIVRYFSWWTKDLVWSSPISNIRKTCSRCNNMKIDKRMEGKKRKIAVGGDDGIGSIVLIAKVHNWLMMMISTKKEGKI